MLKYLIHTSVIVVEDFVKNMNIWKTFVVSASDTDTHMACQLVFGFLWG